MQAIAIKYKEAAYIFHGVTVKDAAHNSMIVEKFAGKKYQLPKGYNLRYDTARVQGCQDHIHIDCRGSMLGAFNLDGSPHDNSNFRIPKTVADYVTQHFPNFTIPDQRFVEASSLSSQGILLVEDIKKGKEFEVLLIIDLDEVGMLEPDEDQMKSLKDLLDYLN